MKVYKTLVINIKVNIITYILIIHFNNSYVYRTIVMDVIILMYILHIICVTLLAQPFLLQIYLRFDEVISL